MLVLWLPCTSWATASALSHGPFDRGKVTSVDWATYPILTFPDAPQVVMDLIDCPKEKPWGAGEPTAAAVPSAIANAIYDAVGARVRSVPFLPGKVLAAMWRG